MLICPKLNLRLIHTQFKSKDDVINENKTAHCAISNSNYLALAVLFALAVVLLITSYFLASHFF